MEKQPKFDYSDIKFKDNGKLKLIIVVGTRPRSFVSPPSSTSAASTST